MTPESVDPSPCRHRLLQSSLIHLCCLLDLGAVRRRVPPVTPSASTSQFCRDSRAKVSMLVTSCAWHVDGKTLATRGSMFKVILREYMEDLFLPITEINLSFQCDQQ